MTWWTSLGPELIKALMVFLLGGGLVSLYRARIGDRERKRRRPMQDNEEMLKLTKLIQGISAESVEAMQAELRDTRADLNKAKDDLRATRMDMESQDGRHHEEIRRLHEEMNARDVFHIEEIRRLRDVIDRLIGILRANAIPVPVTIQSELDEGG